MKNNQTAKIDEVELANNPVRDLSSVEIIARQNTACCRHATSLFDLYCCIPTRHAKGCSLYIFYQAFILTGYRYVISRTTRNKEDVAPKSIDQREIIHLFNAS